MILTTPTAAWCSAGASRSPAGTRVRLGAGERLAHRRSERISRNGPDACGRWLPTQEEPSREGQLGDDAVTKLLTNPLGQPRSTADAGVQSLPQGRSTTQVDCQWHGRSQIAESGPNLGPTPAIGHHGTLLAIGAAAISTLAADAQTDPADLGVKGSRVQMSPARRIRFTSSDLVGPAVNRHSYRPR
jgi:hypothetical protein